MIALIKSPERHGVLDPRICNTMLDANAIDRDGGPRDVLVARLLALDETGEITIVMPGSVRREVKHPRTPRDVMRQLLPAVYSLPVGKTAAEHEKLCDVQRLLRGNAITDKHDADGSHLCEAAKYGGGYFITHDSRLLKKRAALERLLGPALCIVTLQEYLDAYERFRNELQ